MGGLAGELACYQNKIVCAHEFGGMAWRECDKKFRRVKATRPMLGWDQIDVNSWVCIMKHEKKMEAGPSQPFRTGGVVRRPAALSGRARSIGLNWG